MGLLPYEPLGAMGVQVFFALSGYLICRICWREPPDWASYRRFLWRRFVRLAPALGVLVVAGLLMVVRAGGVPLATAFRDAAYAATQTTAFAWAAGTDVHPVFQATWSLTVEWVYYLMFPAVLILLRRRFSTRLVHRQLMVLSIALFVVGLYLSPKLFYLLPVANLAVLFAGATLATWHERLRGIETRVDNGRTAMALLMLAVLPVLPGHTLGWGWKLAVVPAAAVSTLVIIHGCWGKTRAANLLSVKPLQQIGLRAYSLYLWHLPIMWLAWVTVPGSNRIMKALIALGVLALLVPISFSLLERPALRRRPTGAAIGQHGREPIPNPTTFAKRQSEAAARGILGQ
jgi:peptidoglycan/LPS O-acetylase OafA/YrhL